MSEELGNAINSYSLSKLKDIKQKGIAAALSNIANDDITIGGVFAPLIEEARRRENLALLKINPNYLPKDFSSDKVDTLDLNQIVAQIDEKLQLNKLLAIQEELNKALIKKGANGVITIEQELTKQDYILKARGKNNQLDSKDQPLPLTELTPAQQQEIISYIEQKFIDKILNKAEESILDNQGFISKAKNAVKIAAGDVFKQLIITHTNAIVGTPGSIADNIDLGSLEIEINTSALSLTASGKGIINKSGFKITNTGLFFNQMTSTAQQLLYATIQDELNGGNSYLTRFLKDYEKLKQTAIYFQDLNKHDTKLAIEKALQNANMNQIIIDTFNQNFDQIAIKGANANVRGGLGELRTICIINELFGTGSARPTGLTKIKVGTSSEKESPVDAILDILQQDGTKIEIGFQAKNTSNNTYTWDGSMSMPNFYSQRLNETLGGDEEIFFKTYSYNQPTDDASDAYRAEWEGFANNPAFLTKFDALAYKIIRQNIKDVDERVFQNDFFFMNEKLIRSSTILTQINMITQKQFAGRQSTSVPGLDTEFNYSTNTASVWTSSARDTEGHPLFSQGDASNVNVKYAVKLNIRNTATFAMSRSSFNP